MRLTGKSPALLLIILTATSSLSLLTVDSAVAQSTSFSPDTQTFSYGLPGYTVLYGITNYTTSYLIGIYVMDNPPLQISFTEQLPNGTEHRVTKPIAYGMTIASASYPEDVTFTILNNGTSTQKVTKPSVPEFTVKYVDRSYDTQPIYGVDQYTGKTVVTKASEHIDNRTLEITIKNQPFSPFTDAGGNSINLFYNVQYKGSFGKEWVSMFGERSYWAGGAYDPYSTWGYPTQDSSSQYTTISYTLPWNIVDGQIDLQVEALMGYTNKTADPAREHILWIVYLYPFYGLESGWSSTKTVNLANGSVTNATPEPTSPSTPNSTITPAPTLIPTNSSITGNSADSITLPLSTFVIIIVLVGLVTIALSVLLLRRHR